MDPSHESPNEIASAVASAAAAIRSAAHLVAFTGAGISAESGIPPFRGENGIWSRYDPKVLDIDYFSRDPASCWPVIREIFYDFFGRARPNGAHLALATLEREGRLKTLITQNIDDLHYRAGSREVIEYHGNSRMLACPRCGLRREVAQIDLGTLPPRCDCGAVLKPDFVFFGEAIPQRALAASEAAARSADVMLVIGTTGEVYPAAMLPREAARRGATIIEVNPEVSAYTVEVTDIFVRLPAVEAMRRIALAMGGAP